MDIDVKPFVEHIRKYYKYWDAYLEQLSGDLALAQGYINGFEIAGLIKQEPDLVSTVLETILSFVPGHAGTAVKAAEALSKVLSVAAASEKASPTLVASKPTVEFWLGRSLPSKAARGVGTEKKKITTAAGFINALKSQIDDARTFAAKERVAMVEQFFAPMASSAIKYWGNRKKKAVDYIWRMLKGAVPHPPGGAVGNVTMAGDRGLKHAIDANFEWKVTEAYIVLWARAKQVYLLNDQFAASDDDSELVGMSSDQVKFVVENGREFRSLSFLGKTNLIKANIAKRWGLGVKYKHANYSEPQTANIPVWQW